jgi:homocitrate synthase
MLSNIINASRRAAASVRTLSSVRRTRADKLNNTQDFRIIDSTLREGEQFASAHFTSQDRRDIARMLDAFGAEYIELTTPAASSQAFKDCEDIASMGLKSKILTHVRCHMDDVKAAVRSGVQGVNVFCGTSEYLRKFSHGKDISHILDKAQEVVEYVRSHGLEIRFSTEDSFRSDLADVLKIYAAVDAMGVDRVGIADTVGIASPTQVAELVSAVRNAVDCDIEFHAHNDTGCAVANSFTSLEAGATHIDTCVLGIGERNGITPLGSLIARLYTVNSTYVKSKYDLKAISELEGFVARKVGITVPFNNCITGSSAFTHKAGVHIKAVLQNPECYEVLKPSDFGVERTINIASRLTGWNALQGRANQLGLDLSVDQIKQVTNVVKNLSDSQHVSAAEVDAMLRRAAASAPVEVEVHVAAQSRQAAESVVV